jgi:Cu-Zn family superoxide dismutase
MKTLIRNIFSVLIIAGFIYAVGCNKKEAETNIDAKKEDMKNDKITTKQDTTGGKHTGTTMNKATARIAPLGSNTVTGTITFTEVPGGVQVSANLQGLTSGEHGIHIHEKGDCSSPDGKSAGEHFNPMSHQHGAPNNDNSHAGDLGNIKADDKGNAKLEFTSTTISLTGPNSITGKSVIIHKKADDLKTQPSGDSGDRIGCGVVMNDK